MQEYLYALNLNLRFVPAESAYLMLGILRKQQKTCLKHKLTERLGTGILAERCVEELQGVADLILHRYTPHLDPDTQLAMSTKER